MSTPVVAFEIVDSSRSVIEPANVFGEHYTKGMHGPEVAREMREAFKRAQKFGAFKGVKVSITSSRFAGGSSVDVRILAAPFAVNDRRSLVANIRRGSPRVSTSARMRLLCAQLEMLANMWRRDESDSMTDYFDCNCYLNVEVRIEDRDEWRDARAAVAGASLRGIVERIDALSPLADDRPALAVEMLARGELAAAVDLVRVVAEGAPSPESHAACAVLAVAADIERQPYECADAARVARPHVTRALAAVGRGAEYVDGLIAAALAA